MSACSTRAIHYNLVDIHLLSLKVLGRLIHQAGSVNHVTNLGDLWSLVKWIVSKPKVLCQCYVRFETLRSVI